MFLDAYQFCSVILRSVKSGTFPFNWSVCSQYFALKMAIFTVLVYFILASVWIMIFDRILILLDFGKNPNAGKPYAWAEGIAS